jgi:hypothetical protein
MADVAPCNLADVDRVSEELSASIIGAIERNLLERRNGVRMNSISFYKMLSVYDRNGIK